MQGYTCEMPPAAEVAAFYRRLDELYNTPSSPLGQRQPIADLKPEQEFTGNRQERRKQAKAARSARKRSR